ncbi:hypothetical protein GCM10010275_43670 [Streptomyces litmocidini]|nr:hypothetical protein GCM10010275_43670 [Streptomyces litmocidini]
MPGAWVTTADEEELSVGQADVALHADIMSFDGVPGAIRRPESPGLVTVAKQADEHGRIIAPEGTGRGSRRARSRSGGSRADLRLLWAGPARKRTGPPSR